MVILQGKTLEALNSGTATDSPARFSRVQTLFLDIDDTLWENNLFFLASHQALYRIGRECGLTDEAASWILESKEDVNIVWKGFGYDSYEASLLSAVRQIAAMGGKESRAAAYRQTILQWTSYLRSHPILWLPNVKETLPELTRRFQTIIVTKGHPGDQMAKVNRCGLKHLFHAAEVVPHKKPSCYFGLLEKYQLDPAATVMIGNSPQSDINNAKRAGLRTVYIPHPQTWYREHASILPDGPPTIEIHHFEDLLTVLEP